MKDFPVLQTPRCVLNRITDEDILVMRQILDDDSTQKFLPELQSLTRTSNEIRQMLSSFDILLSRDEGIIWGGRLNDTMIAFVAVIDLSYNPTIIYAMHPKFRLKGYMKECVEIVVKYILDNTLCQYMQSEVYKENTASVHLLQSIGFMVTNQDKRKIYLRKEC